MENVTLFDFLKDVSHKKEYIFTDENKSKYEPYVINKFLSMDRETLFYSSYLNKYDMNKSDHFKFLFYALKKQNRFFQYKKGDKIDDLKYISKYYGISLQKAQMYIKYLKDDEIEYIKEKTAIFFKDKEN